MILGNIFDVPVNGYVTTAAKTWTLLSFFWWFFLGTTLWRLLFIRKRETPFFVSIESMCSLVIAVGLMLLAPYCETEALPYLKIAKVMTFMSLAVFLISRWQIRRSKKF